MAASYSVYRRPPTRKLCLTPHSAINVSGAQDMHSITTSGHRIMQRSPSSDVAAAIGARARKALQQLQQMPLLLPSLIVAAALLALFVHLLNAQVLRGEKLREDQRAAATRPVSRVALARLQQPGNTLTVARQPLGQP